MRIESLLGGGDIVSAETGCSKSTIYFSRIATKHKVFCLDDRNLPDSSVAYFMNCSATRLESVETIFGPTQATLPTYSSHTPYDLVLIDGPHGFPFPELEYFFFYPHLKTGALLVIDDIQIPTIGRLADFLSEDQMFERVWRSSGPRQLPPHRRADSRSLRRRLVAAGLQSPPRGFPEACTICRTGSGCRADRISREEVLGSILITNK